MSTQLEGSIENEESKLWLQWKANQSLDLRNRIFEFYFPWCRGIATKFLLKYPHPCLERSDYVHFCALGLLKAIDRYDISKAVPFSAFAYKYISGKVINGASCFFRDAANPSHKFNYTDRLEGGSHEKDPFKAVIDAAVGLAFGYFLEIGVIEAERDDSLCSQFIRYENFKELDRLVEMLPEKQRLVVKSHYYQHLSFKEIAEIMGVGKSRVSQLHKEGLNAIRNMYEGTVKN